MCYRRYTEYNKRYEIYEIISNTPYDEDEMQEYVNNMFGHFEDILCKYNFDSPNQLYEFLDKHKNKVKKFINRRNVK